MAIDRLEIATGLLVKGIRVNGNYLIVEDCDLSMNQNITQTWLIQGGEYPGPAKFEKKMIKGKIICPVRVDEDGVLEEGIREFLIHAAKPATGIRIDTNHAYSHLGLTVTDGGTSNNSLVSFDCCVVTSAELSAAPNTEVKLTLEITGMIDDRDPSDLTAPPDGFRLGRALTWSDCDASRYESEMRTVSSFSISIKNETETPVFLVPGGTTERNDQIHLIVTPQWQWGGMYEEILRKEAEQHTYIHGGWIVNENLVMQFGPITATIPVPLFSPSTQPYSSRFLKRAVKFNSQMSPSSRRAGALFSFS